ncbi:GNAT family N-acetyltransferase [Burkholderia sp. KBS0801]|jgi:GNAT superfamily N-acetyltransferase|uniref:GNAT family N-acetyltransferase n=1 Tax=Burkholderia sp. KBS0801 TaxID=1179675 RepID=UPI00110F0F3F|nr:GNAT family N-acetyltransferase [Burkholderia sp. KBS0801]QDW50008.1 GNAT family N-acetyltransferase [Burkholderia sp. KBS0801]
MLTIRAITRDSASDLADVLRVFMEAPSYTVLVEGRPPSNADVDDFFNGMLAGKVATDKFTIGFYVDTDMVGCADVIRSHPANDCAFIGLLLFSQAHQGRGYGKIALNVIEEMARGWNCSKMQLASISTNPRAFAFWHREGFEVMYRTSIPRFIGDVIVMERAIA